jgi:nitronate monooxygenase
MMSYGAAGVSVGSPFIASEEAAVTQEYKQACVDYGAADIVMTERISGTPCTVINTLCSEDWY